MAEGSPPTKRAQLDFSTTFNVLVGPEKAPFTIHHDAATRRSKFLHAARSPRWTQDPGIFSMYFQCLYSDKVTLDCPLVDEWKKDGRTTTKTNALHSEMHSCLKKLIMLYSCADKLEDLISANLAIDALIQFCDKANRISRGNRLLPLAYQCTPSTSPLRTLLVDLAVFESLETFFDDNLDEFPRDFLFDFAKKHSKIKQGSPSKTVKAAYNQRISEFAKCHYHQHNDEQPKCD